MNAVSSCYENLAYH